MKLYFAAAAAIALFAAAPANAASVMSAGRTAQEDCSGAAASQARAPLSERALGNGLAACKVALTGDLSQLARAGTLVNRGILEAAAGRNEAAMTDFNAGLARDSNLAAGYMNRGAALLRSGRYDEARADFDHAIDLNTADLHVAYFNRGEAQEASGNLVAAYHDYRKARNWRRTSSPPVWNWRVSRSPSAAWPIFAEVSLLQGPRRTPKLGRRGL